MAAKNKFDTHTPGFGARPVHKCRGCGKEFRSCHSAAFHPCPPPEEKGLDMRPVQVVLMEDERRLREFMAIYGITTGRISPHVPAIRVPAIHGSLWLRHRFDQPVQVSLGQTLALDYSKLEERLLARLCDETGTIIAEHWAKLEPQRCPWDDWKPSRDVG